MALDQLDLGLIFYVAGNDILQGDRLGEFAVTREGALERDCFVIVENKNERVFIRRGLNQDSGSPLHDCFILRKDGSIESPIDWDYETVTRVVARPIDENTLTLLHAVGDRCEYAAAQG